MKIHTLQRIYILRVRKTNLGQKCGENIARK